MSIAHITSVKSFSSCVNRAIRFHLKKVIAERNAGAMTSMLKVLLKKDLNLLLSLSAGEWDAYDICHYNDAIDENI